MRLRCSLSVAVIVASCLGLATAFAAAPWTQVAAKGNTTLTLAKPKVSVVITTGPGALPSPPGTVQGSGDNHVAQITVSVENHSVIVLRSVFCDLFAPVQAKLENGKSGLFMLTVEGGDGMNAYLARIEFDAKRVRRKTIASPEDENEPLVETIYRAP